MKYNLITYSIGFLILISINFFDNNNFLNSSYQDQVNTHYQNKN